MPRADPAQQRRPEVTLSNTLFFSCDRESTYDVHISPMGYIMLKNVETTSDEQIMRGVWGGGAAYLPTRGYCAAAEYQSVESQQSHQMN
jgi:hypothetical protein